MLFLLLFLPIVSSFIHRYNHSTPSTASPYDEDSFVDDLYFSRDGQVRFSRILTFQGPHIVRHSTFAQRFKLGYKLLLVCEAEGHPRPSVVWYKNGAEINRFKTIQIKEKHLSRSRIQSKLEVDPTSLADQGVYGCLANNPHGYQLKQMRVDYYY